jgi:hypothetical protein
MPRLIVEALSGESKFVDIINRLELFVTVCDAATGTAIPGLQPKHFRICVPHGKLFGVSVDTCMEAVWEPGSTDPSGCYALSIAITKDGGGQPLEWMEGEFYPFGIQVRFSDNNNQVHMGQTVVRVQSLGK